MKTKLFIITIISFFFAISNLSAQQRDNGTRVPTKKTKVKTALDVDSKDHRTGLDLKPIRKDPEPNVKNDRRNKNSRKQKSNRPTTRPDKIDENKNGKDIKLLPRRQKNRRN